LYRYQKPDLTFVFASGVIGKYWRLYLPKGINMTKTISILTLGPEVEAQQVLEALPDLGEEVLSRVFISVLLSPYEKLESARTFVFKEQDGSTDENSAFVASGLFGLLVSDRRFGEMHAFQSVSIGVRRLGVGQGRGTVEILDKVK